MPRRSLIRVEVKGIRLYTKVLTLILIQSFVHYSHFVLLGSYFVLPRVVVFLCCVLLFSFVLFCLFLQTEIWYLFSDLIFGTIGSERVKN